jgi:hypothetical protein
VNDYLKSLIAPITTWAYGLYISTVRTVLPGIVAWAIVQLTPVLGWLEIKPNDEAVTSAAVVFVAGLWYVLARSFENQTKVAWLATIGGYMLGIPKVPVYVPVHPDNAILMGSTSTEKV